MLDKLIDYFTPTKISYTLIDPIDEKYVRVITRWPGQKVCARIERKALDNVGEIEFV